MKGQKQIFGHNRDDWATPWSVFYRIQEMYNLVFTLDPCASLENQKCPRFFSNIEDGLKQSWQGHTVFLNPPYSAANQWVKKASEEANGDCTIVALLAARTDTRFFHDWILGKAEVTFWKGRIKFEGAKHSAPFPSMTCLFSQRDSSSIQLVEAGTQDDRNVSV